MLIFYVIEGGRVVDPATKMHFDATLSQQQSESPQKKRIWMPHCPNNSLNLPIKNGFWCHTVPKISQNLPIKTEWNRCNGICLVFGPNILYKQNKLGHPLQTWQARFLCGEITRRHFCNSAPKCPLVPRGNGRHFEFLPKIVFHSLNQLTRGECKLADPN